MFTERNKNTRDKYFSIFESIFNRLNDLYEMLFKQHMLSADESYQIVRLKESGIFNYEGTSVYIMNLPSGNYKLRFGEDNDLIEGKYLRRGDNFYLKYNEIELQGEPSVEDIVLYVGK